MRECDQSLPVIPTPDVVGLGVLIAFVGSSCLAVLGVFIQYLFFYSPHHEAHLATPEGERPWTAAKRPNPIDAVFLWRFRSLLRHVGIKCAWIQTTQPRSGGLQAALEQSILTMADVHLGMGLSMLIYGFISLSAGLSAYAWWNIVGLVWFSLVTNLVAHSYLRIHYAEKPGKRRWRLCLVVALLMALMVSMIPTARMRSEVMAKPEDQSRLLATRALCYFPNIPKIPKIGPDFGKDFVKDFLKDFWKNFRIGRDDRSSVLAGGYILVLLCLVSISSILLRRYEKPGSSLYSWCQQYRGDMAKPLRGNWIECIRCEHRYLLLAVRPYFAFWLVLRLYTDFLNSILTEILCCGALLAWLLLRYFAIRAIDTSVDFKWSLTQFIALVFFAAPLKALADLLFARKSTVPKATVPTIAEPKPQKSTHSRSRFSVYAWIRSTKRGQEHEHEHDNDAESDATHPLLTPPSPSANNSLAETEHAHGRRASESEHVHNVEPSGERVGYKDLFTGLEGQMYFSTPWFPVALPTLAFATVLYITLLFALPLVNAMLPTEVFRLTGIWYLIYHPALILVFFLSCMAVEERTRSSERAQTWYRILAATTMVLSAVAIIDTLFGLGGIPMSYIAMGWLGFSGLVYLLYGLVAGPGRMAKGKGRSYMGDGDVENQTAPLLGPEPIEHTPTIQVRTFPVPKAIRYHGPSKRARGGKKNYGTIV